MSISVLASLNFPRSPIPDGSLFFDASGRLVVAAKDNNGSLTAPYIERYDPTANTWTTLGSTPPQLQQTAGHAHDSSDRVYVSTGQVIGIAGASANFSSTDRTYMYDPATNTWSECTRIGDLTEWSTSWSQDRRFTWSTFSATGEIWLAGGTTQSTVTGSPGQDVSEAAFGSFGDLYDHTNTLYYSGGVAGTWSQVAQHPAGSGWAENDAFRNDVGDPQVRDPATGKLYVFGGSFGVAAFPQVFDPSTNTWTQIAANTFVVNEWAWDTSTGLVYLMSQTGGAFHRYDPVADAYSTLATPPTSAGGAIVYHQHAIYYVQSGADTTAILQYDIATDTWSTLTETMSVSRQGPTMISDGTGIYILGGFQRATFTFPATVEYLIPGGVTPPPSAARRAFAAVIGD